MLLTFKTLGVPIAEHKTEGPCLVIEFLGITLLSDKLSRLSNKLNSWHTKQSTTLRELQSLIGTLNFACKVIASGRAFLQRIINLTRGVSKPHHHIRLTKGFRDDILMWQTLLKEWNGTGLFLNSVWENSASLSLYTDASGTCTLALGLIWGDFQKPVVAGEMVRPSDTRHKNISIDWEEFYAIVVASYIWGHLWAQKNGLFFTAITKL